MFFMCFLCEVFLSNIKEGVKKPHKHRKFVGLLRFNIRLVVVLIRYLTSCPVVVYVLPSRSIYN